MNDSVQKKTWRIWRRPDVKPYMPYLTIYCIALIGGLAHFADLSPASAFLLVAFGGVVFAAGLGLYALGWSWVVRLIQLLNAFAFIFLGRLTAMGHPAETVSFGAFTLIIFAVCAATPLLVKKEECTICGALRQFD
jgi:hypothetical protein